MQNNAATPLLIFAQSGRFLAQSATQAGYLVWVADCFGDQDTLASCERWQPLPDLSTLSKQQFLATLETITQGETCHLVYGSGIEYCAHLLAYLPDNIQLLANSTNSLNTLIKPKSFFNLLRELDIPFPITCFNHADVDQSYIAKPYIGSGGSNIKPLSSNNNSKTHYFQKKIDGISGSVLFLADGNANTYIISLNRQYVSAVDSSPYRLEMIDTANTKLSAYIAPLSTFCNRIASTLKLKGLNSLDFIISQDNELCVLELNPRPSASMLLHESLKHPIIQRHIDACLGNIVELPPTEPNIINSLRYLYASKDIKITHNINWPKNSSDHPRLNSTIHRGEPICSTLVEAVNHVDAVNKHVEIEQKIMLQLA